MRSIQSIKFRETNEDKIEPVVFIRKKNLTGPLTVCNASFVHKIACFVLMNNWTMNVHGDFCAKQNSNGAMEIEEVDMFRCYFVPCL